MQYVTSIERHGIEKGIQQGLKLGVVGMALRQLQRRLGLLDDATQAHIRALPLEQVEELGDALFDFEALADLTAWLQQHPASAEIAVSP